MHVHFKYIHVNFLMDHFQQQEQDPTNLYIANLPLNVTDNDLKSICLPYGTVSIYLFYYISINYTYWENTHQQKIPLYITMCII